MKSIRLSTLDSLRGLFAVSVVLWHCDNNLLPFNWAGQLWYDHLYLAVDFFFCLSGFVISLNYNGQFDFSALKAFLRKRLRMIYPLLLFSTIVYGVFRTTALLLVPDTLSNRTNWFTVVQDLLNTLFMVNSTPILGITHGMNVPSWSISGEFIAYILFATLALSKRRALVWGLAIVVTLAVFQFVDANHDASNDWGFLRSIIGFGCGVFTSELFQMKAIRNAINTPNLVARVVYGLFAMLAIAFAFHLAASSSDDLIKIIGVDCAFAMVIFLCAVIPNLGGVVLNNPFTSWLGDISYSIYLNHLIVLVIFEKGLLYTGGTEPSVPAKFISLLLSLFTILAYSHLTRVFIEKRFGR
jgi:peptidoglycan/LPS O-acetylase OafA/YrhL